MISFHNDQKIKTKYLNRVIAHQKADNLVRGTGWDGQKGCAVGCTLERYNHKAFEEELGIPEWLARVEDKLFEGMSEARAMKWPGVFLESIPLGVDLNRARAPFILVILNKNVETLESLKEKSLPDDVARAIKGSKKATLQMIEAQKSGDPDSIESAESAARSAARSARSAAGAAAGAAAWSAARSARSAAFDYFADELIKIFRSLK